MLKDLIIIYLLNNNINIEETKLNNYIRTRKIILDNLLGNYYNSKFTKIYIELLENYDIILIKSFIINLNNYVKFENYFPFLKYLYDTYDIKYLKYFIRYLTNNQQQWLFDKILNSSYSHCKLEIEYYNYSYLLKSQNYDNQYLYINQIQIFNSEYLYNINNLLYNKYKYDKFNFGKDYIDFIIDYYNNYYTKTTNFINKILNEINFNYTFTIKINNKEYNVDPLIYFRSYNLSIITIFNKNYNLSLSTIFNKNYNLKKIYPNILLPIFYCILTNDINLFKIIKSYINLNIKTSSTQFTPLLFACSKNNYTFSKLLLENGVEVNIKSKEGSSPLLYAALNNNYELVKLLIENGAKDVPNNNGNSGLSFAIKNKNNNIIQLLKDNQ